MGLRINTNVDAIGANRVLARSSTRLDRNLARLASGTRITSARDDSAGLEISTRMRAGVRSLGQVMRNVNDGMTLAQTADSAVIEASQMIQRIRELAVQAASHGTTDEGRFNLQVEVGSLIEEIDRISSTTAFGGVPILDGRFRNVYVQVGMHSGDTMDLGLRSIRPKFLGRMARPEGLEVDPSLPIDPNGVEINGVKIRGTVHVDDLVSTGLPDGSAIAKAKVINEVSQFTGVRASVLETVYAGMAAGGGTLEGNHHFTINGHLFTGFSFAPNDASGKLEDQINAVYDETGVFAERDEFNQLALIAPDGRNIEVTTNTIQTSFATGFNGGNAETAVIGGGLRLTSTEHIYLSITGPDMDFSLGMGDGLGVTLFNVDPENALDSVDITHPEEANRTIEIADVALRDLTEMRSGFGTLVSRLGAALGNVETQRLNLASSEERISSTDFANEAVDMARNSIVREASVAILSQANTHGNVALSLLRSPLKPHAILNTPMHEFLNQR